MFQGPIVGFTFGAIIKNQNLWRISVRNELIGLLICLIFGQLLLLNRVLSFHFGDARWADVTR